MNTHHRKFETNIHLHLQSHPLHARTHALTRSHSSAEFVVNHPGGEAKIMLAAGKDIGPFWRVYQLHSREGGLPLELLGRMQVGG